MIRHFLRDDELSTNEQLEVLEMAVAPPQKVKREKYALPGGSVVGVCLDPGALGRRAAWAHAIVASGATPLFLDAAPLADPGVLAAQVATQTTGMVVSGSYPTVDEFARHSSVPVMSGGTDAFLPWQTLADLLTIGLHYGGVQRLAGLRLTYLGDGTDARAASVLLGGVIAGMHVQVATGATHHVPEELALHAARLAAGTGGLVELHEDAERACRGANAVIGCPQGHGDSGPHLTDELRALADRTGIVLPVPLGASDLALAALRTHHRALVAQALIKKLQVV